MNESIIGDINGNGANTKPTTRHTIKLSFHNQRQEFIFGFPGRPEVGPRGSNTVRGILKRMALSGDWTLNHIHHLDFGEKIEGDGSQENSNLRTIAENMLQASLSDPEHRERGRPSFIFTGDLNNQPYAALVIRTEDILGEPERVNSGQHPWASELEEKVGVKRYLAMSLHTHPIERPPSPQDYSGLFLSPTDIKARMAVAVITPKRIWMVFRGKHTPQGREVEEAILKEWNQSMVSEELQSHNLLKEEAQWEDNEVYAQTKTLFDMASKYDLQVFTCRVGERVLDKLNRRLKSELLTEYKPLQLPAAGETTK